MKTTRIRFAASVSSLLLASSCTPMAAGSVGTGSSQASGGGGGESSFAGGESASDKKWKPIHLVDRYGERFDITHAVRHYNMRKEWFEFGIGKNTIRPINHPHMIAPGESGYPATSGWGSGPRVIGVSIEGETRSYPIDVLARHEVCNETIGNTQAAVAF